MPIIKPIHLCDLLWNHKASINSNGHTTFVPRDTCSNISMLPFSLSMEMEQNPKRHHKLACCRNAHGPTSKCIQSARVCYLGPNTKWGTFEFKGPWFTNMNFMVTSDPMNIHHMLSKNFSNYIKGQKVHENFDVLGDGIFNSESDSWRYQRKLLSHW